ncbi:MAG: hypothetical protein NWS01_03175 [Burkholderiales bacterium]|jgi:hypothetical protein|nr:hypothetical protein [Burkholderiales bacterium]
MGIHKQVATESKHEHLTPLIQDFVVRARHSISPNITGRIGLEGFDGGAAQRIKDLTS